MANTASTASIKTPHRMVAITGVRMPVWTRRNTLCAGNRSSRDMAHTRRTTVRKMTSPQAKIENVTKIRKTRPMKPPSVEVTMSATGVLDAGAAALAALGAGLFRGTDDLAELLVPSESVHPRQSGEWREPKRTDWREFVAAQIRR